MAPIFVVVGGQLRCRYCSKKFRSPQGLAAHIHMHQRVGDSLLPEGQKLQLRDVPPAPSPAPAKEEVRSPVIIRNVSINEESMPAVKWLMTRRFTIVEKFRIIDKYKEDNNASATCR